MHRPEFLLSIALLVAGLPRVGYAWAPPEAEPKAEAEAEAETEAEAEAEPDSEAAASDETQSPRGNGFAAPTEEKVEYNRSGGSFEEVPPESRHIPEDADERVIVPMADGFNYEGQLYAMPKRDLWLALGKPENYDRFRRQRVWAGVSMVPGMVAAVVGAGWLFGMNLGCSDDVPEEERPASCDEFTTRDGIALGIMVGGVLLVVPGAVWMTREDSVLRKEINAHNAKIGEGRREAWRRGRPRISGGTDGKSFGRLNLSWRF